MNTQNIIEKELDNLEKFRENQHALTQAAKKDFANKIKYGGLGDEIKSNPSKVKILKKPWYDRVAYAIKSFFTKF